VATRWTMNMTTRRTRLHICGVLFLFLLHAQSYGSASSSGFQDSTAKNKTLLTLAQKTVHAIQDKDTAFVSSNIDEKGIFVGIDSDRISAAEFRRQLTGKIGVYCVIFDSTCLPHSNGSTPNALRDLVVGQEVSMDSHEIKGEPEIDAVDVRNHASLPVLFTLLYRYTGKTWKLQQIEYD
jgi:hypothetical protein